MQRKEGYCKKTHRKTQRKDSGRKRKTGQERAVIKGWCVARLALCRGKVRVSEEMGATEIGEGGVYMVYRVSPLKS